MNLVYNVCARLTRATRDKALATAVAGSHPCDELATAVAKALSLAAIFFVALARTPSILEPQTQLRDRHTYTCAITSLVACAAA